MINLRTVTVLVSLLIVGRAFSGVPTLFVAVAEARAQEAPVRARPNVWSATSTAGLKLAGTWTAAEDPATGAVRGTWTLINAQGVTMARGTWAAAKAETGWTGGWRAIVEGRSGEYSGTWTARVKLKPDAKFADLFATAADSAVSGTWRAAGHSGSWAIQAFEQALVPRP